MLSIARHSRHQEGPHSRELRDQEEALQHKCAPKRKEVLVSTLKQELPRS